MPARFVEVKKEEMDSLMEACKFVPVRIQGTGECVYQRFHQKVQKDIGRVVQTGLAIRVYSSVPLHDGTARGKGEDAIRVVVVDTATGRIFWSATRTHRTQGWRDRLLERMRGAWAAASEIPECPTCSRLMVQRQSKRGARFWGCAGYPKCRQTKPLGLPRKVAI